MSSFKKKERRIEALAVYCKSGSAKECSKIEAVPVQVIYNVTSNKVEGNRPALRLVEPPNKKEALKTKKLWDEIESSSKGDPLFEQSRRVVVDEATGEEMALFELVREKRRWEAHARDPSNHPPGKAFEHSLPRPLDDEPIAGRVVVLVYMKPTIEEEEEGARDKKKKYSIPSKKGGARLLDKLKKAAKAESDAVNGVDETNPLKALCELEAELAGEEEPEEKPARPKKKARRG